MSAIRRDFLPADLKRSASHAGVRAAVSVQARQTTQETAWLLELAYGDAFIAAVVGWLPLVSPTLEAELERFSGHPKLRGLRHVLQDEADLYMLQPEFERGLRALRGRGLAYDILVFERQLRSVIALVDRHPDQVFVLDHVAKPRIREGSLEPWRTRILELGRRPNVYCKLSGMVTEADHHTWSAEQLRPYVETVIEAFTPQRLMVGSDWPVCLLACEYPRWIDTVRGLVAGLSQPERAAILGGTACRAYRLEGLR
jgi:L-fuconolactonase